MPTRIIYYDCDICLSRHSDEESAQICEDRGFAKEYTIGCIFGDHTKTAFYKDITFAVAKNDLQNHRNDLTLWACRDTRHGDSLGNERCGGSIFNLDKSDSKIDSEHPTFKRMVKWLEEQKINVTVWDGKNAILLNQWLKLNNSRKIK